MGTACQGAVHRANPDAEHTWLGDSGHRKVTCVHPVEDKDIDAEGKWG